MPAENKTKVTNASVEKFLDSIADENKRKDCYTILEMMKRVTKAKPQMWGTSIVGFVSYHYTYGSGREGDWPVLGFSPRKQAITLYAICGFRPAETLKKLGKHKTGVGCLYIKKLDDVDIEILKQVLESSFEARKMFSAELTKRR